MTESEIIQMFPDATRKERKRNEVEDFGPDNPEFENDFAMYILKISLGVFMVGTAIACVIVIVIKSIW